MLATIWGRREEYAVAAVDVFSGAAFLWAEAAASALRGLGKPFVLTLRGGALPEFARRHPRRVARLLRQADAVTTPSRFLREQMTSYRHDLVLLPNALAVSAATYRRRSPARPRLLWMRAFHPVYDPELGPRTIARLRERFPEVSLTMRGRDKGSLEKTRASARTLGVEREVLFEGPVPHEGVFAAHQGADIFLNTAAVDNTPVSVLEALASGLCVVSTGVGGIPYLLDDGRDALLVPGGDAEAMAEAVARILEDPALAATLSEAGRRKAESFDWGVIAPQWEALLSDAVRRGRR
jgi:glycosyltransferase involved in cell wall biosynthesis